MRAVCWTSTGNPESSSFSRTSLSVPKVSPCHLVSLGSNMPAMSLNPYPPPPPLCYSWSNSKKSHSTVDAHPPFLFCTFHPMILSTWCGNLISYYRPPLRTMAYPRYASAENSVYPKRTLTLLLSFGIIRYLPASSALDEHWSVSVRLKVPRSHMIMMLTYSVCLLILPIL